MSTRMCVCVCVGDTTDEDEEYESEEEGGGGEGGTGQTKRDIGDEEDRSEVCAGAGGGGSTNNTVTGGMAALGELVKDHCSQMSEWCQHTFNQARLGCRTTYAALHYAPAETQKACSPRQVWITHTCTTACVYLGVCAPSPDVCRCVSPARNGHNRASAPSVPFARMKIFIPNRL